MIPEHELFETINALVDRLPRDMAKYVRQGMRDTNKNGYYTANLDGNIGRLRVTGNDRFDCGNWIAGSNRADKLLAEPTLDDSAGLFNIRSLPESKQLYFAHGLDPVALFDEEIPPLGDAYNDSEYLLINALVSTLKKTGVHEGVAFLLTERIPCASCTHVIKEFLGAYPGFEMHVFFLFESPNRGKGHFDLECAGLDRVTVNYVRFATENQVEIVGPW